MQFELFNDALYQCKWYFLPIELRRMLVTIMSNAQYPTHMRGYGNIECTRDSFKEVFSILIYWDCSKLKNWILLKWKWSWFLTLNFLFFSSRQSMGDFHTLCYFAKWMYKISTFDGSNSFERINIRQYVEWWNKFLNKSMLYHSNEFLELIVYCSQIYVNKNEISQRAENWRTHLIDEDFSALRFCCSFHR